MAAITSLFIFFCFHKWLMKRKPCFIFIHFVAYFSTLPFDIQKCVCTQYIFQNSWNFRRWRCRWQRMNAIKVLVNTIFIIIFLGVRYFCNLTIYAFSLWHKNHSFNFFINIIVWLFEKLLSWFFFKYFYGFVLEIDQYIKRVATIDIHYIIEIHIKCWLTYPQEGAWKTVLA